MFNGPLSQDLTFKILLSVFFLDFSAALYSIHTYARSIWLDARMSVGQLGPKCCLCQKVKVITPSTNIWEHSCDFLIPTSYVFYPAILTLMLVCESILKFVLPVGHLDLLLEECIRSHSKCTYNKSPATLSASLLSRTVKC